VVEEEKETRSVCRGGEIRKQFRI